MEFGAGDFQLNEKSYPFAKALLPDCESSAKTYLGLPQWAVPEWKGEFYSPKTAAKNFLYEYSRRLNCVEVSSTFYADVGEESLKKWADTVSEKFRFLPKWPQWITHKSQLLVNREEIHQFLKKLEIFGGKLGTSILQLPPGFSPEFKRELFFFLEAIPQDIPVAIEFRHQDWFRSQRVYEELENYLLNTNRGMVCSDTPGRRDIFHLSFTGSRNVIRFLSDHNEECDKKRIQIWQKWLSGAEKHAEFYFVFHRPDNALTPSLIPFYSDDVWQKIQSLNLGPQQSLF